jgi:hypothetical protein
MVIRPRSCRRSFALVDCIVATVLLGVSLSVMIGLASNAVSSQSVGEHLSTAAMLADEQLQLVLARGPDGYAQSYPIQGACDEPFADYKYKLTFTGGGSVGDPYSVVCAISWSISGRERSISIETLVASRVGSADVQPNPIRAPQTAVIRTP